MWCAIKCTLCFFLTTLFFSLLLSLAISARLSLSGKLGGQDSFESIESFESCDRLTQSWSSQSSFSSLQRVPSYDSFDSEDYPTALHSHKPKGTFKDYVRERSDLSKDKPVIPAAALAGYTGKTSRGRSLYFLNFIESYLEWGRVLQLFIDLFCSRHF